MNPSGASSILGKFELVLKYGKIEVFYHKMNYLLICNIWILGALLEI